MIEKYCPDFTNYIPYLFEKDTSDISSLQHLSNVVYSSKCNFGTPTGIGNESRIETALLFYQYIASIKKDSLLINPKLQNSYYGIDFKNQQENEAFVYPSLWSLPVGKFRKINTLKKRVSRHLKISPKKPNNDTKSNRK